MMWLGIIVVVLIIGAIAMIWMTDTINDHEKPAFSRQMEAVKKAVEEARRNR